jgi:hypothetical protein
MGHSHSGIAGSVQPGQVTGQGAFRGDPDDPENLTSNASIIPANTDTIPDPEHPESHTKVNIKFGILNEREEFAGLFENTIAQSKQAHRVYRQGHRSPLPVFEVGNSNLLKIREVEGGAGLNKEDVHQPSHKGDRRGSSGSDRAPRNADGHETDIPDIPDTSDSEFEGDPGGVTEAGKQKKVMNAKVTFGIMPEDTIWMKRCYLNRTVPFRGHIILSDKYLCFWRKTVGPIGDIKVSRDRAAGVQWR